MFRWALAFQLALILLISLGAYRGVLPTVLPRLPHSDLPIHALLYGLLGAFLDGALGFRRVTPGLSFPRLGAMLVIVAAGIEEYAQRFSARRTSTYSDFIADVLGVLLFSWLAKRISREANS
jgi:polysaccharide biosynthesis protein VpsQ